MLRKNAGGSLRYPFEINENTQGSEVIASNPEISKSTERTEESALPKSSWLATNIDGISVEKTIYNSAIRKGLAEGKAEGLSEGLAEGKAEGLAEGEAKGKAESLLFVAANLKKKGIDLASIVECTGLDEKTVNAL